MTGNLSLAAAEYELEIASRLNPGPWVEHSRNVGLAAKYIAEASGKLDGEQAYILGLLHDIGRRNGRSALKHTIDGYDFATAKGWTDVARICLTHSFPIKDIHADIAEIDISQEQYQFMENFLNLIEYDDYDKLLILCDALAIAEGFCPLEVRFIDTTRRYGIFPFTVSRWDKTYEYKEYFEAMIGRSIYTLLPGILKSVV
ncbi:HD domain-containing protein [Enterococcus sp. LJL90]